MNINKLLVRAVFICLNVAFFTLNVTGTTQSEESDVESIQATDISKESNISHPKILFEDGVYDFGIAGPGQEVIHTFNFTNTGTAHLQINRVSTSCGCTAALVTEKVVSPGEIGSILVTLKTKRYKGKKEETITIYSNDPNNPESVLTIRGIIKTEFAVVPQGLHFGEVKKGDTATSMVQLLQLSSNPLILDKIEANDEYLTTQTSKITEENKKGFNIDITIKPVVPVGEFSEVITLHTNLSKKPRIDIPIWANIAGRIQVQPKAFSFGTVEKGGKILHAITVSSSDGTDFNVLKVVCDLPFINIRTSDDEKDNLVRISGTIDDLSPAGRCSGRIDIYTDDTDQNVIHIPIYGVIQKQKSG